MTKTAPPPPGGPRSLFAVAKMRTPGFRFWVVGALLLGTTSAAVMGGMALFGGPGDGEETAPLADPRDVREPKVSLPTFEPRRYKVARPEAPPAPSEPQQTSAIVPAALVSTPTPADEPRETRRETRKAPERREPTRRERLLLAAAGGSGGGIIDLMGAEGGGDGGASTGGMGDPSSGACEVRGGTGADVQVTTPLSSAVGGVAYGVVQVTVNGIDRETGYPCAAVPVGSKVRFAVETRTTERRVFLRAVAIERPAPARDMIDLADLETAVTDASGMAGVPGTLDSNIGGKAATAVFSTAIDAGLAAIGPLLGAETNVRVGGVNPLERAITKQWEEPDVVNRAAGARVRVVFLSPFVVPAAW